MECRWIKYKRIKEEEELKHKSAEYIFQYYCKKYDNEMVKIYLNENEDFAELITKNTSPDLFVYNKFCKNKKFPENEDIVNLLIENNKFNWLDFLSNKNISKKFKEEIIENNKDIKDETKEIMIKYYNQNIRNN